MFSNLVILRSGKQLLGSGLEGIGHADDDGYPWIRRSALNAIEKRATDTHHQSKGLFLDMCPCTQALYIHSDCGRQSRVKRFMSLVVICRQITHKV